MNYHVRRMLGIPPTPFTARACAGFRPKNDQRPNPHKAPMPKSQPQTRSPPPPSRTNHQSPITNHQSQHLPLVIGTLRFDWGLGFGHWDFFRISDFGFHQQGAPMSSPSPLAPLTPYTESRLRRRLRSICPSEPWIDAQ